MSNGRNGEMPPRKLVPFRGVKPVHESSIRETESEVTTAMRRAYPKIG
jgi:hypothetical protein